MRYLLILVITLSTFGFAQELEMWTRDDAPAQLLQDEIIPAFEEANPGVNVKLQKFAGSGLEEAIDVAFASNQAPDVLGVPGIERRGLNGWLMNLDGIVDSALIETLRPFMVQGQNVIKGEVLSLPVDVYTNRLIYNPDLFVAAGLDPENPPQTFDEVVEAARAITEQTDAFGFGAPLGWSAYYDFMLDPLVIAPEPYLTRQGLFSTRDGKYETEKYLPAIEMVRTMVQDGLVFPGASSLDNDPMRAAFATGDIGMYMATSWDVGTLNDQFQTQVPWRTAPLPIEEGTERLISISLLGGGYSIAADTEYPELAGKLVSYLNGVEGLRPLAERGLVRPLLPELRDVAPEGIYGFEFFSPTELDRPPHVEPTRQLEVQGRSYQDVLNELILRPGNVDLEGELASVAERYQQAYEQAVKAGTVDPAEFKE